MIQNRKSSSLPVFPWKAHFHKPERSSAAIFGGPNLVLLTPCEGLLRKELTSKERLQVSFWFFQWIHWWIRIQRTLFELALSLNRPTRFFEGLAQEPHQSSASSKEFPKSILSYFRVKVGDKPALNRRHLFFVLTLAVHLPTIYYHLVNIQSRFPQLPRIQIEPWNLFLFKLW